MGTANWRDLVIAYRKFKQHSPHMVINIFKDRGSKEERNYAFPFAWYRFEKNVNYLIKNVLDEMCLGCVSNCTITCFGCVFSCSITWWDCVSCFLPPDIKTSTSKYFYTYTILFYLNSVILRLVYYLKTSTPHQNKSTFNVIIKVAQKAFISNWLFKFIFFTVQWMIMLKYKAIDDCWKGKISINKLFLSKENNFIRAWCHLWMKWKYWG